MAEITKALLKEVRSDIDEALKAVGQKHGLQMKCGNASFIPGGNGTMKVEMSSITEGGQVVSKIEEDFKFYASRYGLKPSDLGRTFRNWDGTVYTIVGCKPKAHKYPILATDPSGKRFKFQSYTVKTALNQSASDEAEVIASASDRDEEEFEQWYADVMRNNMD